MRDLYSDDYESVAGGGSARLIPDRLRKVGGAAVFVGLVAVLGLWSYRLGTRDAAEIPVIKAMEGPARIEPEDPGGIQAAHKGLEVNAVLAGRPAAELPEATPAAAPSPRALADEDAPQGELLLAAPAALAERLAAESGGAHARADVEATSVPAEMAALPDEGAPLLGEDPSARLSAVPEGGDMLAPAPDEQPQAALGPRPMNRPSNLARARPAAATTAAAPARAEQAVKTVARAAPAAAQTASVGKGARLVQLGAFDSEGSTRKAWDQLVQRNPDLLASKQLYVERTTANARVFYRLRVAGFQSSDQTRQMCEALRARGIDCIPVTMN
jgi:hypothetical protein